MGQPPMLAAKGAGSFCRESPSACTEGVAANRENIQMMTNRRMTPDLTGEQKKICLISTSMIHPIISTPPLQTPERLHTCQFCKDDAQLLKEQLPDFSNRAAFS
jgi:hypothetical protein